MISIETQNDRTIFKVTGEVTAEEITSRAVEYLSGEQTATSLWDFTRTDKVKISTLDLQGIADSVKRASTKGPVRNVALVGSKNINIGLGKLFAAFAQMAGIPYNYKVFRDLTHAMEWLDGADPNRPA